MEKVTDQSITEDKGHVELQHQPPAGGAIACPRPPACVCVCVCVGEYTPKDFKSSKQD